MTLFFAAAVEKWSDEEQPRFWLFPFLLPPPPYGAPFQFSSFENFFSSGAPPVAVSEHFCRCFFFFLPSLIDAF